jgi:hypothetical protein
MTDLDGLTVRVRLAPDGDTDELIEATGRLRAELLELDVAAVDPISEATAPEHAKGLATVAGSLLVRFGPAGLRAVVDAVRVWATRTNREVEVNYGGDVLKVSGVTTAQQEKIIDAWLARFATGS